MFESIFHIETCDEKKKTKYIDTKKYKHVLNSVEVEFIKYALNNLQYCNDEIFTSVRVQ